MSTKKKTKYLKVKLGIDGKRIYMQVLEQPTGGIDYIASNGIALRSEEYPELSIESVFLRGYDSTRDKDIVSILYATEAKARGRYAEIADAIREYNKSLDAPTIRWEVI